MKYYLLPSIATFALGLAACNTGSAPLSSDFDPMRPPGSGIANAKPSTAGFSAGQFVTAIMDHTAFFNQRPGGGAEADRLLPRGTSMKVILENNGYLKVELDDGKVGFVPMVMVEDSASASQSPPHPAEVQIYPPLATEDLNTPAADQPPGGAIPTVIPPDPTAAPAPLPSGSTVPLPPNGEELKAMQEKASQTR